MTNADDAAPSAALIQDLCLRSETKRMWGGSSRVAFWETFCWFWFVGFVVLFFFSSPFLWFCFVGIVVFFSSPPVWFCFVYVNACFPSVQCVVVFEVFIHFF